MDGLVNSVNRKVLIEQRSGFGGESQRKQVRGGSTDIEGDFNPRLAEWS
jgi:hypothetical protein